MTQLSDSGELSVSSELLEAAAAFVQQELQHVDASHDWTCARPVLQLAAVPHVNGSSVMQMVTG